MNTQHNRNPLSAGAHVTAVVCTHWAQRRDNAARIVDDLRGGTTPPTHIIVLDNNPHVPRGVLLERACAHTDVAVVAGYNWQCRGKYVAALLAPAHYYLLMDDDTSVGRDTVACLMRHATRASVFGYWGVRLAGDPPSFMRGQIIQPHVIDHPVEVDAFHGRGIFASHHALARMVAMEERLRDDWPSEGDDLLIGLANKGGSMVVPMRGEECFVDLDPGDEAMQNAPGYFDMRDEFLTAALAVRDD